MRLNLEFTEKVHDELAEIERRTGAPSKTEVVRRALAIYDLITGHQAEGGKLQFKHADGEVETLRVV